MRALWYAQVISVLGDWAARIALSVLVFRQTNSALATSAVMGASLLPWLGAGQVLATLADKFPHKRVMVVCDLLRGGAFLVLALTPLPTPVVLGITLLAAFADPPFTSARFACLPQVAGEGYQASQVLSNTTNQFGTLLGYGIGGGLVAIASPRTALLINSISFFLGVLFLLPLPSTKSVEEGEHTRSTLPQLSAALHSLWDDPLTRWTALVVTAGTLGTTPAEALVAPYAAHLGHPSGLLVGALAALFPLAALLSMLILPRKGDHGYLLRFIAKNTLIMQGVAFVILVLDPGLPTILLAFAALGFTQLDTVPGGVIMGQRLEQSTRGTAFSILSGALIVAQLGAVTLAGAAVRVIGIETTFVLGTIPAISVASWVLLSTRRGSASPVREQEAGGEGVPLQLATTTLGDSLPLMHHLE